MSKNRYSEEEAAQKPAGEQLKKELGWDLVYAYDEEVLGIGGTLGRKSYSDVVLERDLRYALIELNEWLEEDGAVYRSAANYIPSDLELSDDIVGVEVRMTSILSSLWSGSFAVVTPLRSILGQA